MRGPQFTLRQVEIVIALIGVLLAILVQNPTSLVPLAMASMPVSIGFFIALLVRRSVEKINGISMRSPRILLAMILAGIGVAALAVTILMRAPLAYEFPALRETMVVSILASLGFMIYQVSQGSFRFRLTVEILTLIALLAFTGWAWRPARLIRAAERADALAAQVSEWAEKPNTPKKRDALRRESEWFRRRASSLRLQAFWYGLIHGSHGDYDYDYVYDTEHLVHELGILKAMDAHEMHARKKKKARTR